MDEEAPTRRPPPSWAPPIVVALGFVALALLLRAPALLYSVLNYDESMYLLMGDKMRQGFLPYTALCDLKPVGLFAVFALVSALPMDGVVAGRLTSSVVVGLTAYLLWHLANRLFDDRDRRIGPAAGLAYVVFTLANGGLNFQSELFTNLLALLGLAIALAAVRDGTGRPSLPLMALAGLVLGVGVQVKQVVLFDMLAFLAGFFLLTTPHPALLVQRARESWPALAALGVAALLPTLAVMLTYAASGHWDAWVAGNLTTHRAFYGEDTGPPVSWDAGFRAMVEQAPLWLAALLAPALGWRLARDGRERRALAFLLVWAVVIALLQVFLRFMSDHYFLQFLQPFCLIAAFLLGRAVLVHVDRPAARRVLLAVLVGLGVFAVAKHPYVNALYVARDRYLGGEAWAGDAARKVAADLKPDLRPEDAVYVVGFMPIVYYLTGARIPTRFAFTGLPNQHFPDRDGCPWVEPAEEMRRILEQRPRFIVVEQGVFFRELRPDIKALLLERLAGEYRLRASFGQHPVHHLYPFARFVMNGATAADVYERVEPPRAPPGQPPAAPPPAA
jgi:hypothetical protein